MLTDRHVAEMEAATLNLSPRELKGLTNEHRASVLAIESRLSDLLQGFRSMAQELLRQCMIELSIKYTEETWADGFEYSAWHAVLNGAEKLTPEELARLRRLAEWAGGWYHLLDEAQEPQFIERRDWTERYEIHLKYEESRRR
jgi:hypothetical protein